MNRGDFDALVVLTSELLRDAGVEELADRERYTEQGPEAAGPRLLPPDRQLTEMLLAFARHLAVLDRRTFLSAQDSINGLASDGRLEDAVFLPVTEDGEEIAYSFREAPDLFELRMKLKDLINRLQEESRPSRRRE